MERRPARELDLLVLVVREDEDRSVVRRLVAPPTAPVALPRTANRPEHVASHHVRAAWAQQQVACAGVGVVQRLVEMPVMQLDTATAERVLEALVRSCDKTVERNGHVTGGFAHAASTARVRSNHRCTCHIATVHAATSRHSASQCTVSRAFRFLGEPHRLYESRLRIEILGCASVPEYTRAARTK